MDGNHRRWRIIISFILFAFLLLIIGGASVATSLLIPPDSNKSKSNTSQTQKSGQIKDLQKPSTEDAQDVFDDLICYWTLDDVKEMYAWGDSHKGTDDPRDRVTLGGMECICGYYDRQRDIAYQSAVYAHDFFYDVQAWYRDFYLKDGIYTYDLSTLNTEQYYDKPIIWRIHHPKLYTDASFATSSAYKDKSGKPGYIFMRYDDQITNCFPHTRSEITASMIGQPHDNYDMSFEELAEMVGVDPSQFIFIDIGG